MRQYLPVLWILGVVAACSGSSDGGNDGMPSDLPTPTAGTSTSSPGTAGSQATVGGSSGTSAGGAPAMTAGSPAVGSGGTAAAGSSAATGGKAGAGGTSGVAGASAGAGGGGTKKPPDFKFPTAVGADQKLSSTKEVTDFDGKLARFVGTGSKLGGGDQAEGQDPMFRVKAGGTLKNVIIGAPAADGIHCEGSCTIENVWWEDVGEDAITLDGSSSSNVYRISNSGARKAADKVIQHNGAGTAYVKNFLVEDFGKLYRSCGNCGDQYQRKSEFDTIVANGSKSDIAGVNQKYKDSAKFVNIFADLTMTICERYDGNDSGAEPKSQGSGADGTYCLYSATDITWH